MGPASYSRGDRQRRNQMSARTRILARSFVVLATLVAVQPLAARSASAATPGTRLWLDRYDDAFHRDDFGAAVTTSPDGSTVFVTGCSDCTFSSDFLTVAYDASTGRVLWQRTYDGPDHLGDEATALAVSPDGSKVFVTGRSMGSSTNDD